MNKSHLIQMNPLFFIFAACIYLLSSQKVLASGAFLIEPGVGYKQEKIKLTDTNNQLTTIDYKGPVGLLKLSLYSGAGVSLSLIGEYASGSAEITPLVAEKPKYTHTLAGFQLGVSALNAMKIYLGFAPLNTVELKTNSSFQGFKLSGSTYQAGVMFYPFSRLGIGAQYNIHQYNEVTGEQFTQGKNTKTYFDRIDSQDVTLVMSLLL